MRLPHPQIERWGFLVENPEELFALLGKTCKVEECDLVTEYFEAAIPPVTSLNTLSVMFGYNPGFVWSLLNKTTRYYRTFDLPKGRGKRRRTIAAPKVSLKVIQKWLAHHFNKKWDVPNEVFGFVPGRSHIQAAQCHLGAQWVISVDIKDFFPSVTRATVKECLQHIG